jgi:hypothetical protein
MLRQTMRWRWQAKLEVTSSRAVEELAALAA